MHGLDGTGPDRTVLDRTGTDRTKIRLDDADPPSLDWTVTGLNRTEPSYTGLTALGRTESERAGLVRAEPDQSIPYQTRRAHTNFDQTGPDRTDKTRPDKPARYDAHKV